MTTLTINIEEIKLDEEQIWRAIGADIDHLPDNDFRELANLVTQELKEAIEAKYSYVIVDKIDFRCGRIISNALKQGEKFVILLSTLGANVDNLLRKYQKKDIAKAYIADAIASEFAESVSRRAISNIEDTLDDDYKISNSYSPGYCGWSLKEQKLLFSYFDQEDPCGITLTKSCLMLPIKSISAVLAIGTNVEKQPYGCEICTLKNCYKKSKL